MHSSRPSSQEWTEYKKTRKLLVQSVERYRNENRELREENLKLRAAVINFLVGGTCYEISKNPILYTSDYCGPRVCHWLSAGSRVSYEDRVLNSRQSRSGDEVVQDIREDFNQL